MNGDLAVEPPVNSHQQQQQQQQTNPSSPTSAVVTPQPGLAPVGSGGGGNVFVGPYTLSKTLQRTPMWKAKLGLHRTTGEQVSVRILKKSTLMENNEFRLQMEREVKVLRLLSHPNIIRLHDVLQTPTHVFVVTEHLPGGELFDFVQRESTTTSYMEHATRYFKQIMNAVAYMHNSSSICHRDLKLENVYLDASHNVRLVNFTIAAAMPHAVAGKNSSGLLDTMCGSRHYACPEIVQGIPYSGQAADIWSCGVMLYALTTFTLPFDDDDNEVLFARIKQGMYTMPPTSPTMTPNLKDLISRMLCVSPQKRATATEVLNHPFLLDANTKTN
eukprot:PhM_4_TR1352/c1_g1_i1/m.63405/K08796/BRSK; BR serine/threonine kinase